MGIGAVLTILVALGAPALRLLGDNGFIALALGAGLLAYAATRAVEGVPDDAGSLLLILGVGLVLRLIVLAVPPLLSDDIFRYVWDGRVTAAGINPYRFVPADPALSGLRDDAIYPFINRADYAVTIYPPVAQVFFLLVTRLSESVVAMKIALVACEGVTVAAIIGLLRRLGQPSVGVIAYAWHPLPVWEIANNGHIDGLMVAPMMAGLWLGLARGKALPGAAIVTLGALAKPFALLALPVLWRPWDWRMIGVVTAVVIAAYGPFLSVGRGVIGFLGSGYLGEQRLDSGEGFWALRAWRSLFGTLPGDTIAYLALALLLVALLAIRAGFRQNRNVRSSIRDAASVLLVFLVLLSPDYPWYFLPVVPFLALTGGATGWALTVGGFLLYDVIPGDPQIPFVLRAAVFNGLVLAAALYGWRLRYRKAG